MAAGLFFLASSSAFIDDEALVHAPRLVLVVCWRIFLFLLCFVVLFAPAKLSFAPTKRKKSAADNRKWGYKTMRYAKPLCLLPPCFCCIL